MRTPLIEVKNANVTLCNTSGKHRVLSNITFCLNKGEHVGILGPNGAGKSTFLRLLAGEAWIDQNIGSITWYYQNKAEKSPIMGRRMAALVSPAQQELYTKYQWQLNGEDILLTAFSSSDLLYTTTDAKKNLLVQAMAQDLCCVNLLHMPAQALSQGQLRLLLLGRALLRKPQVLLLDEYLDGLDSQTSQHIIKVLEQIAINTTLVISTHRQQGLIPCMQREFYIQNGILYTNKQPKYHFLNTDLLTTNVEEKINNNHKINPKPIICVNNATVFVERKQVLHNISWELHTGEHWMVHGKNGAGKSTFLRLLAGYEYPAVQGSISRYFSRLYPQEKNCNKLEHIRHAVRLVSEYEQSSYSYDVNGLELVLSGIDNVVGNYRSYTAPEIDEALTLLHYFNLESLEKRSISTLSTGQLRRLFIARALIAKPEVLLLDEPFSTLDTESRIHCMFCLEKIATTLSIILISHHTEDRLSIINRDAHIKDGIMWNKF